MRRVAAVGNSGSGKSTFARALAAKLDVTHIELDSIFHQPRWVPLPPEEFRAAVGQRTQGDAWVLDGNYGVVQDIVWARADTVVWLDYSRSLVMRRVVTRTVRRAATREELWNGNREPMRNFFRWDPEKSIIRWAWTNHDKYAARYAAATNDPQWAHLRFVRLPTPHAADAFLAAA